jgi:exopolyphosphatase/guanosine-5'-triphosphate,3'-diphosphate pyrophosphatase
MNSLKASIDFGTNTARLMVAEVVNATELGKVVHLEREIVRMGGGFSRESGLSPEAIERGLECLKKFAVSLQRYPGAALCAVATSAVRDAVNRDYFLNLVKEQAGITLQVIDGIQEGHITLKGMLCGLDRHYSSLLLFDVGGGSTEYTVMQDGCVLFTKSLPVGVVRLTEGKQSVTAMIDKIERELCQLQNEMTSQGVCWQHEVLVGTAGTATTLAAISLGMDDYDYRLVNNHLLELSEVRRIYEMLLPLSPAERLQIAGLEKGREDLIVAGSLITIKTMEMFGYPAMKVSDYGLLEGLIVAGCG